MVVAEVAEVVADWPRGCAATVGIAIAGVAGRGVVVGSSAPPPSRRVA